MEPIGGDDDHTQAAATTTLQTSLAMDPKEEKQVQSIRDQLKWHSLPDGGEIVGSINSSSSEFNATNNRPHIVWQYFYIFFLISIVRQFESGSPASERKTTRETPDRKGITFSLFSLEDLLQYFIYVLISLYTYILSLLLINCFCSKRPPPPFAQYPYPYQYPYPFPYQYPNPRYIPPENLQQYFGHKRKDVAASLGVSVSTFKRMCRRQGIPEWQNRMGSSGSVSKPHDQHGERNTSTASETPSHNVQTGIEGVLVGQNQETNEFRPDFTEGSIPSNTENGLIIAGRPPDQYGEKNPSPTWKMLSTNGQTEMGNQMVGHLEETNEFLQDFVEGPNGSGSSEWAFQQNNQWTVSTSYPNSNGPEVPHPHIASTQILGENMESLGDRRNSFGSLEEHLLQGLISGSMWTVPPCSDPASSQHMPTITPTMGSSEDRINSLAFVEDLFLEEDDSGSIRWTIPTCSEVSVVRTRDTSLRAITEVPGADWCGPHSQWAMINAAPLNRVFPEVLPPPPPAAPRHPNTRGARVRTQPPPPAESSQPPPSAETSQAGRPRCTRLRRDQDASTFVAFEPEAAAEATEQATGGAEEDSPDAQSKRRRLNAVAESDDEENEDAGAGDGGDDDDDEDQLPLSVHLAAMQARASAPAGGPVAEDVVIVDVSYSPEEQRATEVIQPRAEPVPFPHPEPESSAVAGAASEAHEPPPSMDTCESVGQADIAAEPINAATAQLLREEDEDDVEELPRAAVGGPAADQPGAGSTSTPSGSHQQSTSARIHSTESFLGRVAGGSPGVSNASFLQGPGSNAEQDTAVDAASPHSPACSTSQTHSPHQSARRTPTSRAEPTAPSPDRQLEGSQALGDYELDLNSEMGEQREEAQSKEQSPPRPRPSQPALDLGKGPMETEAAEPIRLFPAGYPIDQACYPLLNAIARSHPETFSSFNPRSVGVGVICLNSLHYTLTPWGQLRYRDFNPKTEADLLEVAQDMQFFGFDLAWLCARSSALRAAGERAALRPEIQDLAAQMESTRQHMANLEARFAQVMQRDTELAATSLNLDDPDPEGLVFADWQS